jgi:hypothetical protein
MENLPFVIWLIGYPLVNTLSLYSAYLRGEEYDEGTKFLGAVTIIVIWVYVATLLYHK